MYRLDERSMALSAELRAGRWNTDRLRTLMQELGEIVAEDFDRTLGPLKAARELILLRGRFRFQLPPVNIT